MRNLERIRKASYRIHWILVIITCGMPLINALVWIFINDLPEYARRTMLPYFVSLPLPAAARMMGFWVSMVSTAVAMYGSYHLMRLFQLYGNGSIFRNANVQSYKRLSRILIWWFFARIAERSLLGVALTLHHPPGQRLLVVGVGSPDLTILLIGSILAIISWVMDEGRKLQEDQDFTV